MTPEKPFESLQTSNNGELLESLMKSISDKLSLNEGSIFAKQDGSICSNQSVTFQKTVVSPNSNTKNPTEVKEPCKGILKKTELPQCLNKSFQVNQDRSLGKEMIASPSTQPSTDSSLQPKSQHGSTQIVTLKYLFKDLYGMLANKSRSFFVCLSFIFVV